MKHLLFLVLCTFTCTAVLAQNYLEGNVTDSETGEPLLGVEVYFPQLEKGAVTNEAGQFKLDNLPEGRYKLIVSFIGYETYSTTIDLKTNKNEIQVALPTSAIEMQEVIVSTPFHKLQRDNVMKVERASVSELRAKGAVTLSEGITNIAGVSSVSTGLGIGKPVIRGLSANRVLVYTQGVRLENQQFGDEHGLGISDAGIESVEVIKGPASLLYGSDALGGVLYLNPEKFAASNSTTGDVNMDYFSNTNGYDLNAGIQTSGNKLKFLIRGTAASHSDYRAGTDERVTNSRFGEYDLKTGLAYEATNFRTEVRYNYNNLEIGIPEEIGEQTAERNPEAPYQKIDNHIISAKNVFFLKDSRIEAIFGYTFNDRKEFEEETPGEIETALAMQLKTFNYNLRYQLPKLGETILGIQGMSQSNRNFGEEVLIPDAQTNDFGILATTHLHFSNSSDLQLGIRYDYRGLSTEESGDPTDFGFISAIDKKYNSFNAAVGYRIDLSENILARVNIASGFRAPNLAELTSNGVHEGTNRYEIGNSDLNNEQNLQLDISAEYNNKHVEFYANGFYNTINDYIFVSPNGEFVEEEAVYLYEQEDAQLFGGEIGLHIHPHPLDWLHLESNFQTVIGELKSGDYLPLIPANRLTNTLRVEFSKKDVWFENGYGFVTLQSTFNQEKISDFETKTDGYSLLNVGLGGNIRIATKEVIIRVSGNNILNETYVAHLSRLKGDGIPNIGRNISVGISVGL